MDEALTLNLMHRLRLPIHARRNCNTFGSLDFVAREHPYLNAGGSELLNCLEDMVLQLVFNTGDCEELHAILDGLHGLAGKLLRLLHVGLSSIVLLFELFVFFVGELFLADD